MHAYRQFIQAELDARGWTPAKLAKRAGMHRQTIYKILDDERPHLGQMPDPNTLESLATGFNLPVERLREAAARSLSNYVGITNDPLTTDLSGVPIDVILHEIRRRVLGTPPDKSQPRASADDADAVIADDITEMEVDGGDNGTQQVG